MKQKEKKSHAQYPGIYVPRCRNFNSEEKPHLIFSNTPTCRTCSKILQRENTNAR